MHSQSFLHFALLVLFTLLCKFVRDPFSFLIPLVFAIKANKVDFEVDVQVFL